ncbi:hypothetical protein EDB85DRAFT_1925969 [Lactarius pseudohatsudake]|nr:hypothetical protein EDB85DRAFT_1925969 [Lactarius pseudohatsudake]
MVEGEGINADLHSRPKLADSSDSLFSMYNEWAKVHDEKMAESWKGDAEGILVFTGLFSAAVAQLLVGSLQNLQLNSQDASAFYLAHIYQLTPGSNASSVHFPSDPTAFVPPKTAIWVNTLWSLSLVISLTCALLATLLQQWARRYLRITQRGDDPQKRARIRELMLQGLKRLIRLRSMAELLPTLLHISVFLFLAGFVVYLSTFNHFVAKMVGACTGASTLLYLYVSFASIISFDSPYYTPLTRLIWVFSMSFSSLVLGIRYFTTLCYSGPEIAEGIRKSFRSYYQRIPRDMAEEAENLAYARSSYLDTSILLRTFNSLDGDRDMAQFLASIPGFYASSRVKRDNHTFEQLNSRQLPSSIMPFMDHILSSNLLDETAKHEQIKNCLRAITANPLLLQCTFQRALLATSDSNMFECADFVRLALAQSQHNNTDLWVKDYARCIVAIAINRVRNYDDNWTVIVRDHLGIEANQHPGNSIRLRNLTYLTRHLKESRLKDSDQFERGRVWHNALIEARTLRVADIAPELRNEFCALWNELVGVAQDQVQASSMKQSNATRILSLLRTVYIPLHTHTNSALHQITASTDDHSLILQMGNMYHQCSEPSHQ